MAFIKLTRLEEPERLAYFNTAHIAFLKEKTIENSFMSQFEGEAKSITIVHLLDGSVHSVEEKLSIILKLIDVAERAR